MQHRKNDHIERAGIGKSLLASFFNVLFLAALTLFSYWAVCFPIFQATPSYHESITFVQSENSTRRFGENAHKDYSFYQGVLEEFYFGEFSAAIAKNYNDAYKTSYTIRHIYNATVLKLPAEATITNYSTTYFSYVLNEDGSVNMDAPAKMAENLNERGLSDVRDLYYQSYSHLEDVLSSVSPRYAESRNHVANVDRFARIASFSFASFTLVFLLPFFLKGHGELGELILKLGRAERKGYTPRWYNHALRLLFVLPLPMVAMLWFNAYSITLLLIFPYFANELLLLLGKEKRSPLDRLSLLVEIDFENSLLFHDEAELDEYEKTALASYQDAEYVSKLSAAEDLNTDLK